MSAPNFSDLTKGQEIAHRTIEVDRAALVRYAGASGDRNPIHWNERFALEVGLPGVIAHGMWTMGSVINVVSDRSEEHTSELQSRGNLVCRLLLVKKKDILRL